MWHNIPFALVLLPLGFASLTAVLKPRAARALMLSINGCCLALSILLLYLVNKGAEAFTVSMGEVGAPFGNELYISHVEALAVTAFDSIMLLSLLSGLRRLNQDVPDNRKSLFYTVCLLLLAATNAISLTNDVFTGYVFIEITTIAACALIFVRRGEENLFAAMRYMLMNLLGSGLFLLGLAMLYSLTGELLLPQIHEKAQQIAFEGKYSFALSACTLLMALGLAIKSALYPFHTWLPNAYSLSTPASSSILSSLVSKLYIFLLIKLVVRGVGLPVFRESGAANILELYALIAVVLGSIDAIREHSVRRMISYSSVAQIGYIFMALSLGTTEGCAAAVFQILVHSFAKAMLFGAIDRLTEVSGGEAHFRALRGSGFRAPLAGLAFTIGAFSITGVPLLGGFSAKLYIASAAVNVGTWRMAAVLSALAISTLLNVIYFMRTVVTIYRRNDLHDKPSGAGVAFAGSIGAFILTNLFLGVGALNVMNILHKGLALWG